MYLILVGWFYVVLMMAVAEAASPSGTLLGALITFVLYGVVPMALILYFMRRPQRLARLRAEAAEASAAPDAGGHAAGAAEPDSVTPVRKEP